MRDTVLIVLLIHPFITGISLQYFRCRTVHFPNSTEPTQYFLRSDFSIKCYDSTWWGLVALPLAVFGVFSVGMPIVVVAALYRRRDKLQEADTIERFGVVYFTYKHEYWYFEVVQMTFKAMLWVTLIFDYNAQLQ